METTMGVDRRSAARTSGSRLRTALLVTSAVALGACGDAGRPAPDAAPDGRAPATDGRAAPAAQARDTTIRIFFSRGDSVVPVERVIPADSAGLETALRLLLRGPTVAERRDGLTSWFSDTTAGALRSAAVTADGAAVVELEDLSLLVPNASSSAGSAMLLRELNATVFENPAIRTVEYRMAGSCEKFHEWLQYECRRVSRP